MALIQKTPLTGEIIANIAATQFTAMAADILAAQEVVPYVGDQDFVPSLWFEVPGANPAVFDFSAGVRQAGYSLNGKVLTLWYNLQFALTKNDSQGKLRLSIPTGYINHQKAIGRLDVALATNFITFPANMKWLVARPVPDQTYLEFRFGGAGDIAMTYAHLADGASHQLQLRGDVTV